MQQWPLMSCHAVLTSLVMSCHGDLLVTFTPLPLSTLPSQSPLSLSPSQHLTSSLNTDSPIMWNRSVGVRRLHVPAWLYVYPLVYSLRGLVRCSNGCIVGSVERFMAHGEVPGGGSAASSQWRRRRSSSALGSRRRPACL